MLMMMIEEVVVFMSDGDGGDGENEKNINHTMQYYLRKVLTKLL